MDYTGTLLIASPHLTDPTFRQTVILLAHQTPKQVLGLVLNRASKKSVGEFWNSAFNHPCDCPDPLFVGGPIVGPLMSLHCGRRLGDFESAPNIFINVDREQIKNIAEDLNEPRRIFLGHSGWSKDQLANEIQSGIWHLLPAESEDLFAPPDDLWIRALQKSTRDTLMRITQIDKFPKDPLNN